MAIKTILFQCLPGTDDIRTIAREAAISSNLAHRNVAATYAHDLVNMHKGAGSELAVYKFYLVQARCHNTRFLC